MVSAIWVQRYGAQVPGESRTPTPWILDDDGEQGATAPVASCTLRADRCGVDVPQEPFLWTWGQAYTPGQLIAHVRRVTCSD